MLELVTTGAFRKDVKLAKKRGYDLSLRACENLSVNNVKKGLL